MDGISSYIGQLSMLGVVLLVATIFVAIAAAFWRKVVETNMVHIVQSRTKTTSYGTGQSSGNVYYRWPSWLPAIGVTHIELPISNFELSLHGYKAYDKERVPFELDVTAFFRIANTNQAAERVSNIGVLKEQLELIMKGAVRKILAGHDIHQIMTDRATFGTQFTDEVRSELEHWGVVPVKNMELMDIRDTDGSKVIFNIMAKKSSFIEMESRTEVAKNKQAAETAEIEAKRTVDISRQDAEQRVGERTAEKDKLVGVAQQKAAQEVKTEEAITAAKAMDVKRVEQVRQAEITKEAAVVGADQDKQTAIIIAEGQLEATRRRAEGVRAEGVAKSDAEKAMQLAPVEAQIVLAKEIGSNEGYQGYLIALKGIEGYIMVGSEQAKALAAADVKVIANSGDAVAGVNSAMQLFTPKGGLAVGGMLEALGNTEEGKSMLEAIQGFMGVAKSTTKGAHLNGANGAIKPDASA